MKRAVSTFVGFVCFVLAAGLTGETPAPAIRSAPHAVAEPVLTAAPKAAQAQRHRPPKPRHQEPIILFTVR